MKLGKLPFIPKEKDFKYNNYRGTTLPPIPATFGHQSLVTDWGMLGNDTLGDCVIAGACHAAMLWTAEDSKEASFTESNAISDYSGACGYNPNDPNSDNGCYIRSVLDYQRLTGMIDANGKRHKIGAFLALDITNLLEVLEAIYLFSVVKIGIQFPASAMDQFNNGQPWTVVPGSPIEGGHDVEIVGVDPDWLYVITWGKVQQMSVEFFKTYCDEAWCPLSTEMLNGNGLSPEGFNLAQLQADLAALPNVSPVPVPVIHNYTLTTTSTGEIAQVGQAAKFEVKVTDGDIPMPDQLIMLIETGVVEGGGALSPTDSEGVANVSIVCDVIGSNTCTCIWYDPTGGKHQVVVSVTWTAVPPKPTMLWHVQIGAFSVKANADAMADKLKVAGYPVYEVQYSSVVD